MKERLKKLSKNTRENVTIGLLTFSGFLLLGAATYLLTHRSPINDIRSASVMITNKKQTSGGTGIILQSSDTETTILTNNHVCEVVKKGGLVTSHVQGTFQVTSLVASNLTDLCLVFVSNNLDINTKLALRSPHMYDKASVSGHPNLLPNVITEGHVSGRNIVTVLSGFRECTEEDKKDELNSLFCMFFNGIPIVKTYESVLVTATIMPGSSGSGVYNNNNDLIGVVFAGSGELGYAWTIPYGQVRNFIENEAPNIPRTTVNQELSLTETEERKRLKIVQQMCKIYTLNPMTHREILNVCSLVNKNLVWDKE